VIPATIKIGEGSIEKNRPLKDKWAVLVGISNFQDPSLNLQYAAKDARDFRNFLINESNFKPDHVKILVDAQATRANIIGALGADWLGTRVGPDDLVLVYISSHGSTATSEAKNTNFVAAYDTNMNNLILAGIPMQWLTAGISKLVKSDRMVLVLDVCHAGAAQLSAKEAAAPLVSEDETGKGLVYRANQEPLVKEKVSSGSEFQVDELRPGKGQVLIASSDANQTSYESKNYKNGVFTFRLMEGLRQEGGQTTLSEACNYMKERVEEEVLRDRGKLQTPVIIQEWQGADLAIGLIVPENQSNAKRKGRNEH